MIFNNFRIEMSICFALPKIVMFSLDFLPRTIFSLLPKCKGLFVLVSGL